MKWSVARALIPVAAACVLVSPVSAQTLVFTNDPAALRDAYSIRPPTRAEELPVFKGGDAIFAILRMDDPRHDLGSFTIPRDGRRILRITWSYQNVDRQYTDVFTQEVSLGNEQAKLNAYAFTLVPAAFDMGFPGLADFLQHVRVLDDGRAELVRAYERPNGDVAFKVRVENDFQLTDTLHNDSARWQKWSQSAFLLNVKAGPGRYAEWKQQHADRFARQQDHGNSACMPTQGARQGEYATGSADSLAVSPDGKLLASGHASGLTLWNLATGKPIVFLPHGHRVPSLAFSPDGSKLASAGAASGDKQCVVIWNLADHRPLRGFLDRSTNAISSVSFSADGRLVLVGSVSVKVWNLVSGAIVYSGEVDSNIDPTSSSKPPFGRMYAAFSPNGKTIAAGDWYGDEGRKGRVSIFETSTMRQLGDLRGYSGPVNIVAFSPDGTLLATGDGSGKVKVWDLGTAAEKYNLSSDSDPVTTLGFSRDGRVLISSSGNTITLRDVSTGEERRTIRGSEPVYATALSADGKTVFIGGRSGTITAWDARTGKSSRRFPESSGLVIQ